MTETTARDTFALDEHIDANIILDEIRNHGKPMTKSEIVRETGVHGIALARSLAYLRQNGFIVAEGDGEMTYRIKQESMEGPEKERSMKSETIAFDQRVLAIVDEKKIVSAKGLCAEYKDMTFWRVWRSLKRLADDGMIDRLNENSERNTWFVSKHLSAAEVERFRGEQRERKLDSMRKKREKRAEKRKVEPRKSVSSIVIETLRKKKIASAYDFDLTRFTELAYKKAVNRMVKDRVLTVVKDAVKFRKRLFALTKDMDDGVITQEMVERKAQSMNNPSENQESVDVVVDVDGEKKTVSIPVAEIKRLLLRVFEPMVES